MIFIVRWRFLAFHSHFLSAFVDLFSLQLYHYRQQTPWKHTDTIIVRLMANTLENGAITSTGALLNLILFLAYPENNLNEIP
jgi:hypothetical protein